MSNPNTLNVADIMRAYEKLDDNDRFIVDNMADKLVKKVKQRWYSIPRLTSSQFGRLQAIELLARVGIWSIREGYYEPECTCTPRDDSCPACRQKASLVYGQEFE